MRRLFDALAAAGLLSMFGLVAMNWSSLPERVPIHFGLSGTPDRWSTPGSVLLLPSAGLFLFIVLSAVAMFPQSWNLPAKVNEENQARVFEAGGEMLACLKAMLEWLFFWILYQTMEVARGSAANLGPMIQVTIPLLFLTMGYYLFRIHKASKART